MKVHLRNTGALIVTVLMALSSAACRTTGSVTRGTDDSAATDGQREPRITNSIGMEFVWIPPGTFMMGSPEGEPGRRTNEKQHQVTLTKGFYMQTSEVTQAQWEAVSGNRDGTGWANRNCDNCPEGCRIASILQSFPSQWKGEEWR